jgi:hypothetical protein
LKCGLYLYFIKTEMWAAYITKCEVGMGGGWIFIIIRAVTEHPITAVVWSDILRQSETPSASLHNAGTNIPMPMSK